MNLLENLIWRCSVKVRLSLIKADIIPQIITALNPQSLDLEESGYIHTSLVRLLTHSVIFATPYCVSQLKITDHDEQHAVSEMVLTQIISPSKQYICHLCTNRNSIVDIDLSNDFVQLLARLLQICPYYHRTMEFVLHMPLTLTIPSSFMSCPNPHSIMFSLEIMYYSQLKWNDHGGEVRQMGKILLPCQRKEGIDDVMEQWLQDDRNGNYGDSLISISLKLIILHGMNVLWRK
ncbi:hypothetical protein BLNAU_9683 [Blattamonas nauphoetae]|uniref:Uncharacterized protein n=1 Tax=Blattamonas nauphoetae TaxID=2049346 RepID=A0ABQ9XUY0_9EUKA|nr:hypothetical protein BLNAU_9683 [Blattamonas nauphoetae]